MFLARMSYPGRLTFHPSSTSELPDLFRKDAHRLFTSTARQIRIQIVSVEVERRTRGTPHRADEYRPPLFIQESGGITLLTVSFTVYFLSY